MTDKKQAKSTGTPSNQIVPANKAVTPVDLVNRYQVLGQIPKPGYNTVLASYPPVSQNYTSVTQSNPYASSQAIQNIQSHQNYLLKNPSPYIPKSQSSNLFYIEPAFVSIRNPIELATAYFPPGWHFIPYHPEKSLQYYTDILLQTKSIFIKDIFDRINPKIIIYHHLYIHQVISQSDWGHPHSLRVLPGHSVPYNYYDYIEAWFKVLLQENDKFTHSWFIQFDQKFKSILPTWFLRWWSQNGAIVEIIPNDLLDQVTYFSSQKKFDEHLSQFPSLLHFMAKYKVPWIFKWKYSISDNIVVRQFLVKWWDRYNHQRIIDQVKTEFPVRVPTPINFPVHQIQQEDRQSCSPVQIESPCSSTSRPRSSNVELIKLAQLLLAQAGHQEDDDDEVTSHTDPFGQIFQDAQDPYA